LLQPFASLFVCGVCCAARREVAAAASSSPKDFDEFLEMVADKFEKVDNKPVVIG